MKIILVSGSPRRIELLRNFQLDFEIHPNHLPEEEFLAGKKFANRQEIAEFSQKIASEKAHWAARQIKENALLLAADTLVVLGRKVLGKPADRQQARRMLESLSDRSHSVITGIALLTLPQGKLRTDFVQTRVWFRKLSPADIRAYLETFEWQDKAGAYGIQGFGSLLVEKIEGDYFNVVGLPLLKVYRMLKEFKIDLLESGR